MTGILGRKLRRDIVRQWPQFTSIAVTILLGVGLFAAAFDAYRNLQDSYEQTFEVTSFADVWLVGGDVPTVAAGVRDDPRVAAVEVRTVADVPMRVDGHKLRGRIVGIPPSGQPSVNALVVEEGAWPADIGEALAEKHLAGHFERGPGDAVEVLDGDEWRQLSLRGVVASAEYLWAARSRQEILTTPDDFGVLFVAQGLAEQIGGPPNEVIVRLTDEARTAREAETILEEAIALGARDGYGRAEQPSNGALQEDINGFSQMSVAFPLLFLTAAGMAAYVLLSRKVTSERELIGMLAANGTRRGPILRHYLAYGLAAGAVGAVGGVVLGMAAARTLTRFYVGFIDLPDVVTVLEVRPATIAIGMAYGLVAGAASALAPALVASRIPPAEAMRGIVPASGGRLSLLERAIPPLRRLPARWRFVLRNLGRNRRRTGYTVLGVVLSLLLVLTAQSLWDTIQAMLDQQFDVAQQQDARVDLVAPGAVDLEELAAVPGVAAVEPLWQAPVTIVAGETRYTTLLRVFTPDTAMHGFPAEGGQPQDLPEEGLLLGKGAPDVLGVTRGAEVTVIVEGLPARMTTTVAGFVDEPLGTLAYASRDAVLASGVPLPPATSAFLAFTPEADRDAVRDAVTELAGVAAYEDAKAFEQLMEEFTGLFRGFVVGMLVFGSAMAFAIMFTTISVNVLERSREVATMRASGVHARRIGSLIAAENLVLVLLGVGPGIVMGLIGGNAMLDSFASDQFRFDFTIEPLSIVLSVAAVVVVAGLSQLPSLRAVRRLDIATVVRERAT